MTDIFISYSREDRPKVQVLAQALEGTGAKVWWDPHIKTGHGFRQEIQASLSQASAVVVVWSQYSVTSRFVCDEADEGAARGILFPALIDLVDIPLGFRQIQTADLTTWRGRKDDKALLEFVSVVADSVGAQSGEPEEAVEEEPEVAEEAAPPDTEEEPEPKPRKAPKPARQPKAKPAKAAAAAKQPRHFVTGQRLRMALLWRSIALTILVAGAFGALAYTSNFIYPQYRPLLIGAIALLVFISRFATFEADRSHGAASLRLLSRSFVGLWLFSLVAIASLVLEGRAYTEALQAVQIKGIEGADINGVAFDPTGKKMATASDDGTARVWDTASGVQRLVLTGHTNWVWSAHFSPDSNSVVTASRDLTARVWDARSGALRFILKGHTASVLDAVYDPKDKLIATASADATVRIWNSETGELERTLSGHTSRVNALAASPDGRYLASADASGFVRVWRWSGSSVAVFEIPGGNLQHVAIDQSGERVAAASEDGRASVWDIGSQSRIVTVNHKTKLFAVAFLGGNRLATGGIDGVVRIWRISNGEMDQELQAHHDAVRDMAVSADGSYLATASRDNTARIWDTATLTEVQIVGHTQPAIHAPVVFDQPPVLFASRAPTSAQLLEHPDRAGYLLGKGIAIALGALLAGLLIKGISMLLKQERAARWVVVWTLGLAAAYVLAMMLTDLPIEASYLWLIAGFVPAAAFALLLWLGKATIFRSRVVERA